MSIVDDFLRGDTAMLITYPAFLTNSTDLRRSSTSIGCSLVPGRRPLLGGWSFGVSRQSAQREQALAFLRWTCDEGHQQLLYDHGRTDGYFQYIHK